MKQEHNNNKAEKFYELGKKFWEESSPTVNALLGGFGHVSTCDIQTSKMFLNLFLMSKANPLGRHRALDCGAGIGRVTKNLLLCYFSKVDMVEQNNAFLEQSYGYMPDDPDQKNCVDRRICSPLQSFMPEATSYDLIWCQWILSHIVSEDIVKFLRRCKSALTKNGLLVIKDNVSSTGDEELDEGDSTVTRSLERWRELVHEAGYVVAREKKQLRFPKELYEVRMFACRPA